MGKIKFTYNKDTLQIFGERMMPASQAAIFAAHTDKKALEAWWGQANDKLKVDKLEVAPGGEWVFKGTDPEQNVFTFFGNFLLLKEPEIIAWTFNFEYPGMPEVVQSVEINQFEKIDADNTKIKFVTQYTSLDAYEGMVQTGMEEGANESWDRLEEYLVE